MSGTSSPLSHTPSSYTPLFCEEYEFRSSTFCDLLQLPVILRHFSYSYSTLFWNILCKFCPHSRRPTWLLTPQCNSVPFVLQTYCCIQGNAHPLVSVTCLKQVDRSKNFFLTSQLSSCVEKEGCFQRLNLPTWLQNKLEVASSSLVVDWLLVFPLYSVLYN